MDYWCEVMPGYVALGGDVNNGVAQLRCGLASASGEPFACAAENGQLKSTAAFVTEASAPWVRAGR